MKKWVFLILIIMYSNSVLSQSHSMGLRIEPFLFLSKNDPVSKIHSETDQIFLDYKSFFVTYNYTITNNMFLSTRIGYLGTSPEIFNGFEIGEYFGYFLSEKGYLLIGFNIHKNQENISQYIVKDVTIPFVVPACGLKISDNINIELQYHYPLSKKYKEQIVQWYDSNSGVYNVYEKTANYNLFGILKLSFGVELNL